MALRAMTTSGTEKFVSITDPSVTKKRKIYNDPKDQSKGYREVAEEWDEDASVFVVRPLDVFLMGHIYDNASVMTGKSGTDEVGIKTKISQTNIDTVRFGLSALPDNFRDRNDKPVRMDTGKDKVNGREYEVCTQSVLDSLGLKLIAEMAQRIKDISEVQPDEEKKSVKD